MKKITHLTVSLILITCPIVGQATEYRYDELNRLTQATYTNGDSVSYRYDAGGNIDEITSSMQSRDSDGDGLTDDWEIAHNLNPNKKDTDGDKMDDKWEVTHGTNALIQDAGYDINTNGYTNLQEYLAQSNPKLDTDNDGMFDIDEITYKTNIKDSGDCPNWYCGGFRKRTQ